MNAAMCASKRQTLNVRNKVVSFYVCHNPQEEEAKSWHSTVNQNKCMPTILELKSGIFPASSTLYKSTLSIEQIALFPLPNMQECEISKVPQKNVMAENGLLLAVGL